MATITRSLSTKTDGNDRVEFMLRINSNRTTRVRVRSGIFVPKDRFTDGKFVYPRANPKLTAELRNIENKLLSLEQLIFSLCETTAPEKLTKDFFEKEIYRFHNPKKERKPKEVEAKLQKKFVELVEEFPDKRGLSEWRHRRYGVLSRSLHRFELYRKIKRRLPYKLDF